MGRKIGLVPASIKFILDAQQLSAAAWLGDFYESDIDRLEIAVRSMANRPQHQNKRHQFLGDFEECPERFEFSLSERKCILKIAQTIREAGIEAFIGPAEQDGKTATSTETYNDPKERSKLIEKLVGCSFAKYVHFTYILFQCLII